MGYSEYFVTSKEPTSDKSILVSTVVARLIGNVVDDDYFERLEIYKELDNYRLQKLFDYHMAKEYPDISSFIKKSLKHCYGGSSFFGLSLIAKNNFITDLRKSFNDL